MPDFDYISEKIEKLGILYFEKKNRSLAVNFFGCHELMEDDREMLKYILNSGAYGTLENSVKNRLKKYGVGARRKIKYLTGRIFPEREKIKTTYPIVVIYRLMKALLMKWRETLREIRILLSL